MWKRTNIRFFREDNRKELTMRKLLLVSVFLLLIFAAWGQVTYHLELTHINPMNVKGIFRIENNTSNTLDYYFGSSANFELWMDGLGPGMAWLPIENEIHIESYGAFEKEVEHSTIQQHDVGTHYLQVHCYNQVPAYPIGPVLSFTVGNGSTAIDNLDFSFVLNHISTESITGTLTIHNQGTTAWYQNFSGGLGFIAVDGDYPEIIPPENFLNYLELDPGESYSADITHLFSTAPTTGIHTATVYLRTYPPIELGLTTDFVINPTATDDPHVPELAQMRVYPNPFRNMLKITVDKGQSPALYNLKGQKLMQWQNQAEISWDGNDAQGCQLPQGMYLIRSGNLIRKVIKLR